MKKLAILWVALFLLFTGLAFFGSLKAKEKEKASSEPKADYVGVEKCRTCHAEHYKDYQARRFARSFQIIKMRKLDKTPECLKCHTTGFGEGGFVSEGVTPQLANKQCEACHGPGSLHASDPTDAKIRKTMKDYLGRDNVCLKCHICMKSHRVVKF